MTRTTLAALSAAALLTAAGQVGAAESSNPAPPPKVAPAPQPAAPPQGKPAPQGQPAPASPPAVEKPPPYEPQLLRLAGMMGALAYLRNLCGAGDGDKFRADMAGLLDAEGVSESRRDLLAGAYNQGFRDYEATYRTCTPAAGEVINRYLSETARLAAEVAGRYGG
jgi:uncharacterized protein (TIGR02301 family)